jgi:hypothetical protein
MLGPRALARPLNAPPAQRARRLNAPPAQRAAGSTRRRSPRHLLTAWPLAAPTAHRAGRSPHQPLTAPAARRTNRSPRGKPTIRARHRLVYETLDIIAGPRARASSAGASIAVRGKPRTDCAAPRRDMTSDVSCAFPRITVRHVVTSDQRILGKLSNDLGPRVVPSLLARFIG